MSLGRRKDSSFWWVKLPPIRGESKALQQSTGTADKREAKQVCDQLAVARWEQDRLGVKAPHTWEESVVRWLPETEHKATHESDKAKLRWLDSYLGGRQRTEIDRTLINRIKFDREKVVVEGTTNRYLALIRSIPAARVRRVGMDRPGAEVQAVQGSGRTCPLAQSGRVREVAKRTSAALGRHGHFFGGDRAASGERQWAGMELC